MIMIMIIILFMVKQTSASESLDTLRECSARLDSLLSFAQLCEQEGAKSSHDPLWDHHAKAGIYLMLKEESHHLKLVLGNKKPLAF